MVNDVERAFFESLKLPLILCSYNNGVLKAEVVSDGLCEVARSPREEMLKSYHNDFFASAYPDDMVWLQREAEKLLKDHKDFDCIYRYQRVEKNEYILLHAIAKWQTMSDGSEMIILSYNNMRNTKTSVGQWYTSTQDKQNELLYQDKVTGVPNLNYLRQFADERIFDLRLSDKRPILIHLDVIAMHSYNSHYGYEQGDELIKLIASAIQEVFPDSLFGRGVDDHFAIVTDMTEENLICGKIETINTKVKQEALGNVEGIRAGIYEFEPGIDFMRGYDYSHQALKMIGHNRNVTCCFYSKENDDQYWKEHYIIETFETALKNKWIKVFYQPIIRSSTQKVATVEALARWIDPVRGIISPGEFIPVLSRHHLLHKLDGYMVKQVCEEFGKKKENGIAIVPVSVNFSAQDFDYTNVAENLKEMVDKYKVSPSNLIVEVTEQEIAKGTDHFKEQLRKIRENGHRIWIDDFGSGYSSLNVFAQYGIDRIKFDMDLLRHLDDNNGANRKIMKAMAHACNEMGVRTLAEGVETAEQFDFLQEIGCEMAQGFYFYKPVPLEDCIYKIQKQGICLPFETLDEKTVKGTISPLYKKDGNICDCARN